MDSYHVKSVKLEQTTSALFCKYRQLKHVAILFRIVELCVVFIVISKYSTQLPGVIKSSSEYLKDFSMIFLSPKFGFLIGNIIVITLFMKSGYFSTQDSSKNNIGGTQHVYEEFVEKSKRAHNNNYVVDHPSCGEEKIVQVDKYTTTTTNIVRNKKIYRTKSENCEKARATLKRTVTDICPKKKDSCCQKLVKRSFSGENLSNEEFKSTIEAFIARQQRFLREEEEDYSSLVISY